MPNECAVCYVSDKNFLLPSLISAMRVRHFVAVDKADIYLLSTEADVALTQQLSRFCEPHGIHVLSMDSAAYSGFDKDKAGKLYEFLPPAALGRLVMESLLPASSKRIVYLDGDTWINGDPTPLIDAIVPEGRFAAAEDPASFCRHDITRNGKVVRDYLKALDIDLRRGYFNSGVMASSRATWRQVAAEAYDYFVKHTDACRYYDQSALNAVIGDRRVNLSLAWNFQTPYRNLNVENNIAPRIYHFTQFPKPWMVRMNPWMQMFAVYEHEIRRISSLNLPKKTIPDHELHAANANVVRQKKKMRYVLPVRWWMRHRNIRDYEARSFCRLPVG